jgi:hypothetical protein
MKLSSVLLGLVIGAIIGFAANSLFRSNAPSTTGQDANSRLTDTAKWQWPDSLDAVHASPQNHKIIFENKDVRILSVILEPYEFEHLHTHSLPSVMFGRDNDTSSFDIIYYPYAYDSVNHRYFARDSIRQHRGGHADKDSKGHFMKPEGPHRIKNLSNVRIVAYRVEFKRPGT